MGGATLASMIPEISYNAIAKPGDCPKCGKRLSTNVWRTERDWEGNPEPVFMFLCLILLALLTSARERGSQEGF